MKKRNIMIVVIASIVLLILVAIIKIFIILFMYYVSYKSATIDINKDINKYNDYIGSTAKEEYQNKWGMDESIFPQKITRNMNISDYKMVYYNPWDAQYLSYLVVNYSDDDYEKEVNRLTKYKSTNYIGYYNVSGFHKYNLLAMNADSYQGFVYAITNQKNQIIYVELIFCNYFYDIDYKKYINEDYLPDEFDATKDNSYRKKELEKN